MTYFRNGRKLSRCHVRQFSEIGGKCPKVMCDSFLKREENVPKSLVTFLWNSRKMFQCHVLDFSETGGKCPNAFYSSPDKNKWNGRKLSSHYSYLEQGWYCPLGPSSLGRQIYLMETRRKMSMVDNVTGKLPPWKIKFKEYLFLGVFSSGWILWLGNTV
mgnify:FL=1